MYKQAGIRAIQVQIATLSAHRVEVVPCPHCNFRTPEQLEQVNQNNSIDVEIRQLQSCILELENG